MNPHLTDGQKLVKPKPPFLLIVILAVLTTAFIILLISQPAESMVSGDRSRSVALVEASQSTPLPNEILQNREQTNGVIFGGVILVLIIVGGTLSMIGRKNLRK
jgi:hypothetical protein